MWKRLLSFLLRLVGVFFFLQVALRSLAKLRPFPCPFAFGWVVESPLRRRFFPPERTLDRIGIEPGMKVLELGPGPGYFTPETSRRVGPEGKLYAVDIQPAMIARVREKVETLGLTNVEPSVAGAYDLPFPDNALDLAFLVTVLGEIPDPARALGELYRVLRPGGRLSITELLPDPHYTLPSTVRQLAEAAGFRYEEMRGSLPFYTANFRKGAEASGDH